MTEEVENTPKIEPEVKEEAEVPQEDSKDLIPELYAKHGGDPRQVELAYCVLLSGIPTDFLADPFEQFEDTIKTIFKVGHNLKEEAIKKIVRIPILDGKAENPNAALRALICFTDKMQQCRCVARIKNFADDHQKVEIIDSLPEDFLHITPEIRENISKNGDNEKEEVKMEQVEEHEEDIEEDDDVGDEVDEDVGDEVDELMEEDEEGGHDEHDEEDDESKKDETEEGDSKNVSVKEEKTPEKKPETPKKKVYEDEDDKVAFDMEWEGAPEFQWRLCDGTRDEKKLIIENLMWADLNNVFIYRTIQKATSCEMFFPTRFTNEGTRAIYGKLTLCFPAFVPIMDEALKHLVYFRSGDNRRIKVFLPQTTMSLKRKEEFEGKLGRLIKPTPRMMELIIKILPDGYVPTLDDACAWFPEQSVIGCDVVNDEMGKPCAVVKFETAQEAVAAHASRSFIIIQHPNDKEAEEESSEKKEKDEGETSGENKHHCNVFMRGVEAHFGSLLTFYDQRKKAQEQIRQNRPKRQVAPSQKRPAGSTIRGPAQKKRAPSPKRTPHGKEMAPRGGPRGGASAPRRGPSGPRRSSPPRSNTRPSGPRGPPRGGSSGHPGRGGGSTGRGGGRTGDRGVSRSMAPRSNNYRTDSFSSSSQRQPARADAFSGYGYAQFENRYNAGGSGGGGGDHRQSVDPFGRPMYNVTAFQSTTTSFHRSDDGHRSGSSAGGGGFSSYQDNRRRY